jgi:hypothetical protein
VLLDQYVAAVDAGVRRVGIEEKIAAAAGDEGMGVGDGEQMAADESVISLLRGIAFAVEGDVAAAECGVRPEVGEISAAVGDGRVGISDASDVAAGGGEINSPLSAAAAADEINFVAADGGVDQYAAGEIEISLPAGIGVLLSATTVKPEV